MEHIPLEMEGCSSKTLHPVAFALATLMCIVLCTRPYSIGHVLMHCIRRYSMPPLSRCLRGLRISEQAAAPRAELGCGPLPTDLVSTMAVFTMPCRDAALRYGFCALESPSRLISLCSPLLTLPGACRWSWQAYLGFDHERQCEDPSPGG